MKSHFIHALTTLNIGISCFVWAPTWLRIYRNKSARDQSLLTLGIVEYLQLSNLTIALLTHTWSLAAYLAVNATIVGITAGMVLVYQRRH